MKLKIPGRKNNQDEAEDNNQHVNRTLEGMAVQVASSSCAISIDHKRLTKTTIDKVNLSLALLCHRLGNLLVSFPSVDSTRLVVFICGFLARRKRAFLFFAAHVCLWHIFFLSRIKVCVCVCVCAENYSTAKGEKVREERFSIYWLRGCLVLFPLAGASLLLMANPRVSRSASQSFL